MLVLASASPPGSASCGPPGSTHVEVADVDEPALLAATPDAGPGAKVTGLAGPRHDRRPPDRDAHPDAAVIGCDSMLLIEGEPVGKPADVDTARRRWRTMAGRTGMLVTGHAVLRMEDGEIDRVAEGHAVTEVRFASPSEAELEAYLATGEPLAVAGAFTLDGLGGWFVEGIEGDPSNVIGISLPLTRRLLAAVGVSVTDLWRRD